MKKKNTGLFFIAHGKRLEMLCIMAKRGGRPIRTKKIIDYYKDESIQPTIITSKWQQQQQTQFYSNSLNNSNNSNKPSSKYSNHKPSSTISSIKRWAGQHFPEKIHYRVNWINQFKANVREDYDLQNKRAEGRAPEDTKEQQRKETTATVAE